MKEHKLLKEQTLSSEEVFNGRLLHVFLDHAELPDGSESTREWIKHPGASAVVPLFDNGDIMMLKQFRYPLKQTFLEVPAGKIDAGENHRHTAERELMEEAGLKGDVHYIGPFYPCIGYSDEVIHIYLADNLQETAQQVDEDEFVLRERIPFGEAVSKVHSGEITDGKTMICLLRAFEWLKQKNGA